jgi:putative ABC transport system permease protein
MNRLPTIWRWVQGIVRRRVVKQQIDEELRFHIEKRTMENIAAGMSEAEAEREARKRFGNFQAVREECRDARRANFWETLAQDAQFGFRILAKKPGFTAIAILILSVGIGATAAIYSVLDAFVLNPLPGPYPGQLSEITEFNSVKSQEWRVSPTLFQDFRALTNLFSRVATYEFDGLTFESGDFLKSVPGAKVTAEFFSVFGVSPLLGRTFNSEETSPGHDQVLVISHAFWQARFGGNKDIIGTTVRLENKPWTIIGVMPQGFEYPSRETRFWRPIEFSSEQINGTHQRWERNWWCVARQRPEVTRTQVQSVLRDMGKRLEKEHPDICAGWIIQLHPLRDRFVNATVRATLWGLLGALALLLAVICATVAGLQTVRLASRRQELSIRISLGAGRWRLVRQLTVESLVLVGLGMCLGFVIFKMSSGIFLNLVPGDAPMLRPLGLDWNIVLLTSGACFVLGVIFGVFTALAATRFSLAETLKQGAGTATAGRHSRRLTSVLVTAEVALALSLVISASLLARSVWKALQVDPGFDSDHLARVWVDWLSSPYKDSSKAVEVARDLAERLRALPGTVAVGLYSSGQGADFMAEGNPSPVEIWFPAIDLGTNDFFHAVRGRLVTGRWLDQSENSPGQNTVIVNETLAKACWPGQSAIGKHLWMGKTPSAMTNGAGRVVVGVVRDLREWSYTQSVRPILFEPIARSFMPYPDFWVRTRLDHASFAHAVRDQIKGMVPQTLEPGISWVSQDLYASTSGQRLYASSLAALAGLGLLLASLGVYGVLSYMVGERTREIAVRMALGAQPADVTRLVVAQAAAIVGCGILVGGLMAIVATRMVRSQLFGIGPSDPVAWEITAAALLLAAALASYLPARKAAHVDPMLALRCE